MDAGKPMNATNAANCIDCHRTNYSRSKIDSCSACGGELVPTSKRLPIDRSQSESRREACRSCEHYGSHRRRGKEIYGCGLLSKPCGVEDRWYLPTIHWCPKDRVASNQRLHTANIPRTILAQHAVIITPHYNPAGFARLDATLQEWLPTMPNGVIVERGDGKPENIMWQKERLINRAIEQLDPAVRYVCWCDHDICFERSDWLIEACRMIDRGTVAVQPWDTIHYMDANGQIERESTGAAGVFAAGGKPGTGPGGCWVASREWLDSIGGLYDRNIVGGGDATWFEAISGQRSHYRDRQPPASQRHLGEWVDRVGPVAIGYVAGAVRHLWHGDRANRQYVSRDTILCRWQFDPDVHVTIDAAGLLAWTDAAPQGLRDDVAGYFAGRREDG